MTTVAAALDRVSRMVGVSTPDNWITATALEHVEIRDDFLLEAINEVQERVDLPPPLSARATITGDGSETYSLPSDFKRLHRDRMAVYESTNTRRALYPVSNAGDWTQLKVEGGTGSTSYYRLTGYEGNWSISLYREPVASQTFYVHYVSTNWKATSGGTAGDEFTDVGDVLLLPRRIVELGAVMRWRHRKGLPYDAVMGEFEAELHRLSNDRSGRRVVAFGERQSLASPFDIPVPDFIPDS